MKLGSNRKAVGMGLDLREGPGSVSCHFVIVTIVAVVIIVTFVINMINIILSSWVLASARVTTTLGEVEGRSWTTSPWDLENR